MTRVWLITGTSTGLGRATVEKALSIGDRVVATLRKPSALDDIKSKYDASKLLVLPLDVTNTSDIQSAFAKAKETFGRVDVVFDNAAGAGTSGEAEAVPVDEARKMFEANFWGSCAVALEAVRFFREENKPQGGILLKTASSNAVDGIPGTSYYAASKFASEGFYDALVKELDPKWNIKIQVMNPGGFKTEFSVTNTKIAPLHPAYADLPQGHSLKMIRDLMDYMKTGADIGLPPPRAFADAVVTVLEARERGEEVPFRVPVGWDSIKAFEDKAKALREAGEKFRYLSNIKDFKFMAPNPTNTAEL